MNITKRIEYPRTLHLPFSYGRSSDDNVIQDLSTFEGKEVVITIKMNGECTTMYNDYIHARSIDGKYHTSRDWIRKFHSSIKQNIPVGDRICGENMYAVHTIHYTDLESYFYGFSYWSNLLCLDYDNTISIFRNLNIAFPTELYRGCFDLNIIEDIANSFPVDTHEGFVVRNVDSFHYQDFQSNVVKWVRPNQQSTNDAWMYNKFTTNNIREVQ